MHPTTTIATSEDTNHRSILGMDIPTPPSKLKTDILARNRRDAPLILSHQHIQLTGYYAIRGFRYSTTLFAEDRQGHMPLERVRVNDSELRNLVNYVRALSK